MGLSGPPSRHRIEHALPEDTVLFEEGDVANFQIIRVSGSVHLFCRTATDAKC